MAARINPLRLIRQVAPTNFFSEPSQGLSASTNSIFTRHDFFKRWIQTAPTIQTNQRNEDLENQDSTSLETVSSPNLKHSVLSNLKMSARHDMAMIFTCKVCETRSTKTLCRESYEKGVVLARCAGCNNMHLIADRLGWFGEPGSIEELLASRGEEVRKGNVDTMNLTLEDLAGPSLKNLSPEQLNEGSH